MPPVPQLSLWLTRLAWLGVAIVGGRAVGEALDAHSRVVQVTGTAAAWVGWSLGVGALALTAVATLTLARTVIPASLIVAVWALADRADVASGIALLTPAVAATALAGSAEFGRCYIQASAYGDEERFGLRPPIGYLVASIGTWLVTAVALIAAPLAVAGRAWIVAAVCAVVGGAGLALLPKRWHQLSRRWLVFVPAGVVVHDPVVLGDTLMMPKRTVESFALDEQGAAAQHGADLTGPTPGLAVEIRLTGETTARLAPTPKHREGTVIEISALVISPSRPGAVIRAARRREYADGRGGDADGRGGDADA